MLVLAACGDPAPVAPDDTEDTDAAVDSDVLDTDDTDDVADTDPGDSGVLGPPSLVPGAFEGARPLRGLGGGVDARGHAIGVLEGATVVGGAFDHVSDVAVDGIA